MEGGRVIPGASTVHFDEISRKRIFASVDNANFSDIKLIKENYNNLKNKLGRIPALRDFDDYGEMDVIRIFDNNSLGSYYKFLVKYEKEYTIRLSEDEEKVIEFVSKKLASGKRIQELQLLKRILVYTRGISKIGLFAGGALFGSAGIELLTSKDAKKVYTQCTAAVLRMKDQVMKTATTLQENCGDILADAKEINEQRAAEDDAVLEDTAEEKAE